mmetsp:Transcript_20467/g.62315  ORF Transcript_20467/g.62315 Transcript_20467/m.62315 type:complete len:265 (+) Transcript_20467:274-1068(+)
MLRLRRRRRAMAAGASTRRRCLERSLAACLRLFSTSTRLMGSTASSVGQRRMALRRVCAKPKSRPKSSCEPTPKPSSEAPRFRRKPPTLRCHSPSSVTTSGSRRPGVECCVSERTDMTSASIMSCSPGMSGAGSTFSAAGKKSPCSPSSTLDNASELTTDTYLAAGSVRIVASGLGGALENGDADERLDMEPGVRDGSGVGPASGLGQEPYSSAKAAAMGAPKAAGAAAAGTCASDSAISSRNTPSASISVLVRRKLAGQPFAS